MSTLSKEALSALLDNEADDLELRRLLQSWEQLSASGQAELADTWGRYHLAQAVLHNQGVPVSSRLSTGIQAQLAREPSHALPAFGHWQQALTKLAIAASVAVIVVVGMQVSLVQQPATPVADAQSEPTPSAATQEATALVADTREFQLDPEAQRLTQEYMRDIVIDPAEPMGFEQFQDSPLYRLVNELQDRNQPD